MRAPEKKTSLNSEPPVICSIGRISMPSWSIGISRNDSPWWRDDPGSVRAMTKIQSDSWAPRSTPSGRRRPTRPRLVEHGAGAGRGEVGAGAGLGVALAPQLVDRPDPGQEALLLLVGAELDQRRAEQLLAEVVDQLRRVGPGVLLVEDDLLGQAEPAAAVLLRPAEAGPAVLGEVAVPGPPFLGPRARLARSAEPFRDAQSPARCSASQPRTCSRKASSSKCSHEVAYQALVWLVWLKRGFVGDTSGACARAPPRSSATPRPL